MKLVRKCQFNLELFHVERWFQRLIYIYISTADPQSSSSFFSTGEIILSKSDYLYFLGGNKKQTDTKSYQILTEWVYYIMDVSLIIQKKYPISKNTAGPLILDVNTSVQKIHRGSIYYRTVLLE